LVYFDALAGACISKGKGGGGIDGVLGLVPSAEQEKKGIFHCGPPILLLDITASSVYTLFKRR